MGFPRQEYWSGLPFPSAGDLPDPGIELRSPALADDSLPLSHQGSSNFVHTLVLLPRLDCKSLCLCIYHSIVTPMRGQ